MREERYETDAGQIISDLFHNNALTLLTPRQIFKTSERTVFGLTPGAVGLYEMMADTVIADRVHMAPAVNIRYPHISKQIMVIVGGFGSGKTEIAVNLARYLVSTGKLAVTIVDLDLVNPYFRTREAVGEMEAMGVRVIVPRGGQFYADLPILLPEVKGAVEKPAGNLILDVGGDAQGSRALGSLAEAFVPGTYDMLMVLNSRRPLTSDCPRSIATMARIETSAKLKFTGLVINSHMIEETDVEVLMEGYHLARDVRARTDLPLAFMSVKSELVDLIDPGVIDCPILPLSRSMLKPWERKQGPAGNDRGNLRE